MRVSKSWRTLVASKRFDGLVYFALFAILLIQLIKLGDKPGLYFDAMYPDYIGVQYLFPQQYYVRSQAAEPWLCQIYHGNIGVWITLLSVLITGTTSHCIWHCCCCLCGNALFYFDPSAGGCTQRACSRSSVGIYGMALSLDRGHHAVLYEPGGKFVRSGMCPTLLELPGNTRPSHQIDSWMVFVGCFVLYLFLFSVFCAGLSCGNLACIASARLESNA